MYNNYCRVYLLYSRKYILVIIAKKFPWIFLVVLMLSSGTWTVLELYSLDGLLNCRSREARVFLIYPTSPRRTGKAI